jgi:4-hydroxybenzoate polyprenyltransferase
MHRLDPTMTKATTFLHELSERGLTQGTTDRDLATSQKQSRHFKPNKISIWIEDNKSLIVLLYMVAGMGFCTWATGSYMHVPNPIWPTLALSAFVLGIYFLNWIAESRTDFLNDSSRIGVVKRPFLYWSLVIGCFSTGLIIATYQNSMHWSILLLIAIGVLYSFPLLPWYEKNARWHYTRIKDVAFLKSLTVACCFTAYVFGFPLIFSGPLTNTPSELGWLIMGFLLMVFSDTVYDDLLDYPGDKIENVPTLPVMLGVRNCTYLLIALSVTWFTVVFTAWLSGHLNVNYMVFLSIVAFYPIVWMTVRRYAPKKRVALDLLIESDTLLWALGSLWLAQLAQ